jgi:hypothetical protein
MCVQENVSYSIALLCTGEAVKIIARGVGILVAIVSVFLAALVIILSHMVIAMLIKEFGISTLFLALATVSWGALKTRKASMGAFWTAFRQSCN